MSSRGNLVLLEDLQRYAEAWPEDDPATLARYRAFVETTPGCCHRTHLEGHCTGSAFISCRKGERVLLLFHPFLQRWLQPGGHADGDPDLQAVARREAEEETGLRKLTPYGDRIPFDLDIHDIPARKQEPAHLHYDLRYLFVADPDDPLIPETDTLELAWLTLQQVEAKTEEESVLRMVRKLRALPRDAEGLLDQPETHTL